MTAPNPDSDPDDPLAHYQAITPLKEQIEPYRDYGDTELAIALLCFGKREAQTLPNLRSDYEDRSTFDVPSQPADVGANYECPECGEEVRLVHRQDACTCPACGAGVSMLALGEYRS